MFDADCRLNRKVLGIFRCQVIFQTVRCLDLVAGVLKYQHYLEIKTSHLWGSLTIFNLRANLSGPNLFLEPCSTSMQLLFALWVCLKKCAAPISSGSSWFSDLSMDMGHSFWWNPFQTVFDDFPESGVFMESPQPVVVSIHMLSQQNYAAPNSSGLSSFSRCEQPWIGGVLLLTKPTSCGEPQKWKVSDHQNGQSLVALLVFHFSDLHILHISTKYIPTSPLLILHFIP